MVYVIVRVETAENENVMMLHVGEAIEARYACILPLT